MLSSITKKIKEVVQKWSKDRPILEERLEIKVLHVSRLDHERQSIRPESDLKDELCFFRLNGDMISGERTSRFSALGALWDMDGEIRMVYVEHELMNQDKKMSKRFRNNFDVVYEDVIASNACKCWMAEHSPVAGVA